MKARKIDYKKMMLGKEDHICPTVTRPNLDPTYKKVSISPKQAKKSIKKLSKICQKRG